MNFQAAVINKYQQNFSKSRKGNHNFSSAEIISEQPSIRSNKEKEDASRKNIIANVDQFPLVSIGVLNYNNSKWVVETLDSLINLEYPNLELIISDDCSTDDSLEKIESWLSKNIVNYILIKNDVNRGLVYCCNKTFKLSNGKYFSLFATDDIITADRIKKQVDILEAKNNVGAVFSDAIVIDENGAFINESFIKMHRPDLLEIPSGKIFEDLLVGNFVPAMTMLIKSDIIKKIGNFDQNLPFEDYDMWLRIASKYEIRYVDMIGAKYRFRKNSLARTIPSWEKPIIRILEKHTKSKTALKKLESLAIDAYSLNNRRSLALFSTTYSIKILLIKLFTLINLSPTIGLRIIKRIK